jgi:hypothetical protein
MPAVGATTFWMNSPAGGRASAPAPRAAAGCRTAALPAATCWPATGSRADCCCWRVPSCSAGLLQSSAALRIAALPTLALWTAAGCWCAQMQPPVPTQPALQHYADGLSRNVRGRVVRVRNLPELQQETESPQNRCVRGRWSPARGSRCDHPAPVHRPQSRCRGGHDAGRRLDAAGQRRRAHHTQRASLRRFAVAICWSCRCVCAHRMSIAIPGAWSYADELLSEGIGVLSSGAQRPMHRSLSQHRSRLALPPLRRAELGRRTATGLR